jgi:hypothetical protein
VSANSGVLELVRPEIWQNEENEESRRFANHYENDTNRVINENIIKQIVSFRDEVEFSEPSQWKLQ